VLRFITGLGLGAAMPNAVTLMSEYCPDSRRAALTNAMFCGFPLGAAFGGFLAAWMIPAFGWRSVLLLGGGAPLLLVLLLVLLLPESVRHMVAKASRWSASAPCWRASPARPCRARALRADRDRRPFRRQERHRRGAVGALPRRLADAVAGLLHGPGDLLCADQLDAGAVQGRRPRPQDRHPDRGTVPAGRRGRRSSAG
jgi:MFS family permease